MSENVVGSLQEVRNKLAGALGDISLPNVVAVSKTHEIEAIIPLLKAGHRIFAENRVQEAQSKWSRLKQEYQDIELHLIGPLQTNKVKEAVALFDVIQTLDRPKLAKVLATEYKRVGRTVPCFIQVNTGEEEQKAGVMPAQVDEFIDYCRNELDLPIVGLMCIPPVNQDAAMHFLLLKKIAKRNNVKGLSMGMSNDYVLAATLGATYIRVGSAIFGSRVL